MPRQKSDIRISNKKADYLYFLIDRYTAGIVLYGTEIKSIREGKASLNEAYCTFAGKLGGELFVRNMHVSEYSHGTAYNHLAKRERKLLLTRRELYKLQNKVKERGFTIIPVTLFIDENGRAKLEIALARGKKLYDKRETIKEKDLKRDIDRSVLLK